MLPCALVLFLQSPAAAPQPVEYGCVRWEHDLEAGLARATAEHKPVFLLFQEVPGCSTCQGFGNGPLSHPLLVEAIEDEFVPVAVQNNREGRDADVLHRYQEPAWNNPVVRFLDARGQDLIPRQDGVWDSYGIATRMLAALGAAGRPLPQYLALAAEEEDPAPTEQATFGMHCYWEGEANFGQLEGVLATRAGWDGSEEVVEVTYRPSRIRREVLEQRAQSAQCRAQPRPPQRDVAEPERKHYLRQSPMNLLPLTPLQVVRVNAALGLQRDPSAWLSPRQRALLDRIQETDRKKDDALEGLQRPESLAGLARYEAELRARLL